MIKWTTPTLVCTIPEVEFDYILFTIKGKYNTVERTITEVEENEFKVTLTQEESALFVDGETVKVQLNFIKGKVRMATDIVELEIERNLHEAKL